MTKQNTFIKDVLSGNASPDQIDDYVAAWHTSPTATNTLAEALGMTDEQYEQWATNPDCLPQIILSARTETNAGPSLESMIQSLITNKENTGNIPLVLSMLYDEIRSIRHNMTHVPVDYIDHIPHRTATPLRGTAHAAAYDLEVFGIYETLSNGKPDAENLKMFDNIDQHGSTIITQSPHTQRYYDVGISYAILDPNVFASLYPRSSASAQQIRLSNTVGIIDSDYRGRLILGIATGSKSLEVTVGMRLAQMVFMRRLNAVWTKTDTLPSSTRDHSGYGSTGA